MTGPDGELDVELVVEPMTGGGLDPDAAAAVRRVIVEESWGETGRLARAKLSGDL
jgi:hypothetical protein